MKNLLTPFNKISFLSLFVLLFSFSAIAQKGSGNVIKKNVKVDRFDGIKIGDAYDIFLRQGDKEKVTIVADDNIMENIKVTVNDGVLRIKSDNYMTNPTELKAYITVKNLKSINISGACNIEGKNTIVSKNLSIKSSGASDIELALRCSSLKVVSSGASEIKLSGDAAVLNIDASGASSIEAEKLASTQALIESSGASTVKIDVSETLDAKASGASTILYQGDPKVTANKSGAADVKKM